MIAQVKDNGGTKTLKQISGSTPTGNPVGTLLSRANGQVPRNYLECDGSTFNAGQYPALYLYLGTNVLPTYFDHSILSDAETITNFQVGYEMPYDGFIIPDGVWTSTGNTGYLKIDDKTVSSYGTIPSGNAYASAGNTIAVKKGQQVTAMVMDSHITYKAMWFKKHLYIKAVDGVDISDEDTFLDTVKNFVQEKNSYSTTEMLTGGTWIDGKPIYRWVYDNGSYVSNLDIDVSSLNIDVLIHTEVIGNDNTSGTGNKWNYGATSSRDAYIQSSNNHLVTSGNLYKRYAIIEYTKTTD